MNIGGFDLEVTSEEQLAKALDWVQSKFPVNDEWDEESLWIYLPGHNEHQGMVQVICGKDSWTVVVDSCFGNELLDYLR